VDRRRAILIRAIGEHLQLKRESLKRNDPLKGLAGELIEVRRTKATLDFDGDKWDVPIVQILLPGSVEPDLRQLDLFTAPEVAR